MKSLLILAGVTGGLGLGYVSNLPQGKPDAAPGNAGGNTAQLQYQLQQVNMQQAGYASSGQEVMRQSAGMREIPHSVPEWGGRSLTAGRSMGVPAMRSGGG
jgi:hypothetical protein